MTQALRLVCHTSELHDEFVIKIVASQDVEESSQPEGLASESAVDSRARDWLHTGHYPDGLILTVWATPTETLPHMVAPGPGAEPVRGAIVAGAARRKTLKGRERSIRSPEAAGGETRSPALADQNGSSQRGPGAPTDFQ